MNRLSREEQCGAIADDDGDRVRAGQALAMLDVEESMLDYSQGEKRRVRATVGTDLSH